MHTENPDELLDGPPSLPRFASKEDDELAEQIFAMLGPRERFPVGTSTTTSNDESRDPSRRRQGHTTVRTQPSPPKSSSPVPRIRRLHQTLPKATTDHDNVHSSPTSRTIPLNISADTPAPPPKSRRSRQAAEHTLAGLKLPNAPLPPIPQSTDSSAARRLKLTPTQRVSVQRSDASRTLSDHPQHDVQLQGHPPMPPSNSNARATAARGAQERNPGSVRVARERIPERMARESRRETVLRESRRGEAMVSIPPAASSEADGAVARSMDGGDGGEEGRRDDDMRVGTRTRGEDVKSRVNGRWGLVLEKTVGLWRQRHRSG